MSLVIRLSILVVLVVAAEFYFYKKILSTLKNFFIKRGSLKIKRAVLFVFSFFNLFLVVGIVVLTYYAVTRASITFPPDSLLFDIFLQFPFWLFIIYMVQCFLLFILIDLLRLIFSPLYKTKKEIVSKWVYKIQFAIIIFFAVYVPARSLFDYLTVSTRIVEYKKKDLPKALQGFKITFIADVQADKYTNRTRLGRFIDKVNKTNPDLVLIAGDVITSTPDYIDLSAEFLGKIKSKYGIYSCVGDHDNWAYRHDTQRSLREVTAALNKKNIEMIDNEKRIIPVDSTKIEITFATNNYVHSIDRKLLDTLATNKNNYDLKIFLTHQPRAFLVDKAKEKNYDLFLAGHTHGGQLTFLFPFYDLSPTLIETKYVRGDFHFGDMLAIVTRGLGMSLVPLRYNSTPEVTVIVLEAK